MATLSKLFKTCSFDRFLPFVHLPPVEDTMAIFRLKWTALPRDRTTSASILILAILSGKSFFVTLKIEIYLENRGS